MGSGSGGDHGAHFHVFGLITGMIDFDDLPGGQANLVAVGRCTRGRAASNGDLRQFAGQGVGNVFARIGAAGQAHGLIHVGAPGKRIAYRAADAGGGAAEGLDFGGVVMGFVFELQQPGLRFAVINGAVIDINKHGAGVHFRRDFHGWQFALGTTIARVDGGEIHKSKRAAG